MTVYFVTLIDKPDRVKIGCSVDIDKRLTVLANQIGPLELLAVVEGGDEAERAFHRVFEADWIEGEWFKRTEVLEALIAALSKNVSARRVFGRSRVEAEMELSPIEQDKAIAHALMQQIMDMFGAVTFGAAHSSTFDLLHARNPLWTRRRIRAIWNKEASRIEHFEVRDMQAVLASNVVQLRGAA